MQTISTLQRQLTRPGYQISSIRFLSSLKPRLANLETGSAVAKSRGSAQPGLSYITQACCYSMSQQAISTVSTKRRCSNSSTNNAMRSSLSSLVIGKARLASARRFQRFSETLIINIFIFVRINKAVDIAQFKCIHANNKIVNDMTFNS